MICFQEMQSSHLPLKRERQSYIYKTIMPKVSSLCARRLPSIVLQTSVSSIVLVYITFCNILLAFWNAKRQVQMSSQNNGDEGSLPESTKRSKEELAISAGVEYTIDMEDGPDVDEIEITDDFVDSFQQFLKRHNIELRFFAGSWETFEVSEPYNVVLTSETVYDVDNLPHLVKLLKEASHPTPKSGDLTLVACKRVYFGVGGGEVAFKSVVETDDGQVENLWTGGSGVERTVMRTSWPR